MSALRSRLRSTLPGAGRWGVSGERADDDLPRGGARGSAWMAVAALIVGLVATPFGVDLGRSDFGRVLDGVVQQQTGDGWRNLEAPATIPAGAELRTGERPARVEVAGGELTLAENTEVHARLEEPQVRRGSLLVEAEEVLRVRVGATTAEGRGQWRVDVDVASRVATYRARVDLDDGTSQRRIGRFRQVSVRDGALEPGLRPLRYSEQDTWDEWLLADALAVDRLGQRLRGTLERSYGGAPRGADFYAAFVAVEDAGFVEDLPELAMTVDDDTFGPPADVLVGVAVVDALATDAGFTPDEALDRVVDLRRAGGTWGLVLVEHDLGAAALRAAADRALQQAEETPPPAAPDDVEATIPVVPVATEGSGPAPGDDAGDPQPAPTPTPTPPPGPSPTPPEEGDDDPGDGGGALEPVEDVIRDTGDTLGDVVEDTGGTVGDLLRDTTDTLADVVGDVGSLLEPSGSTNSSGSTGDQDTDEPTGLLGR